MGSNQEMQLLSLLERLNRENIKYVSWKNNHELKESTLGLSDLDVYVPASDREGFLRVLASVNAIKVASYVAKFPHVEHFYIYDGGTKFFHLHVYFKIITGDSWLKEYELPLGDFFIENRVQDLDTKVWILSPECQKYVFYIRHGVKCSSITGRILYLREFKSYSAEYERLNRELSKSHLVADPLRLDVDYDALGMKNKLNIANYQAGARVRGALNRYRRFGVVTGKIKVFKSFSKRLVNRLFLKRNKVMPARGIIIAISGVDGSGKSTMIDTLGTILRSFLTVKNIQLGKPYGRLLERLIHKSNDKYSKLNNGPKNNKGNRRYGVMASTRSAVLAYLRCREAKKAVRLIKKGFVVVSDRWPSLINGKMDGPKLQDSSFDRKQLFQRLMQRIEHYYYSKIPKADVVILLSVSLDSALRRNSERDKKFKETNAEIVERYEMNLVHKCICEKQLSFYNDGALEHMVPKLLNLIVNEISNKTFLEPC